MKHAMPATPQDGPLERPPGRQPARPGGFSLIELIIVMVIIGILATQVIISMTSSVIDVKGAALNMRSDFNLAKSEAISRDEDVRIDFIFPALGLDLDGDNDSGDSGYWMCVNNDSSSVGCGNGDIQIKKVALRNGVQFYDDTVPITFTDGPTQSPAGAALAGSDGVSFSGQNWFEMRADGSANMGGYAIFYVPDNPTAPTKMEAPPFALVVLQATGRVTLWRWSNGAWDTK